VNYVVIGILNLLTNAMFLWYISLSK